MFALTEQSVEVAQGTIARTRLPERSQLHRDDLPDWQPRGPAVRSCQIHM